MPIIVVTGKEIEKIKGDFESYLNGLNMVGEISYSQYSELYDEGTKQIQRAYELGKSELEKENEELKTEKIPQLERKIASIRGCHKVDLAKLNARIEQVERLKKENAELKKLFADCDTCKRTCDIGNCCKFGSDYLPDVEKVLNEQKQLTKAKEIVKEFVEWANWQGNSKCPSFKSIQEKAEQFLREVEK